MLYEPIINNVQVSVDIEILQAIKKLLEDKLRGE